MNIGYETKEFHSWLRDTFNWVDSDVKKYMFKAWRARAKLSESTDVDVEELEDNC